MSLLVNCSAKIFLLWEPGGEDIGCVRWDPGAFPSQKSQTQFT